MISHELQDHFRERLLNSNSNVLNLKSHFIITINMQHLYEAYKYPTLRSLFFHNERAIFTLDGRGAALLFKVHLGLQQPLQAGNELVRDILSDPIRRLFFVVGSDHASLESVRRLYPQHSILAIHDIFELTDPTQAITIGRKLMSQFIQPFDVIFVALGIPKQELLAASLSGLQDAPVLCIGGSFEILTNRFPRAPRWINWIGLEGAWRLIKQPNSNRLYRLLKTYGYFIMFFIRPKLILKTLGKSGSVGDP